MDDTREIAAKAADILRSDGWVQGAYLDVVTGSHCMVGAIIEAATPGNLAEWYTSSGDVELLPNPWDRESDEPITRLLRWLEEDVAPNWGLLSWNDSDDREESEVIAALDRASLLS